MIRLLFKDKLSDDATEFLLPWYESLSQLKFSGLSQQTGDYNILYQTFIVLFTYIPIKAIYAIKTFSCVFDFLLAGLASCIIYKTESGNRMLKALVVYSAVLFSPLVFLNSSYWAQCDAVYTFFCIFSLYLMAKEKYLLSFVVFGVAMTFKLQSIFILPLLLFLYFYTKKFSIVNFFVIPIIMIILSLPGIIAGRSIMDSFSIYASQTTSVQQMAMNYPSFWLLLRNQDFGSYYKNFSRVAICLTIVILAIYMIIWLKKKVRITTKSIICMAFIVVYTCVFFLPAMHERYGFICDILGLLIVFYNKKTIPMLAFMYVTTLVTYGNFLFHNKTDLYVFAFINLFTYIAYSAVLNYQLFHSSDHYKKCKQERKLES